MQRHSTSEAVIPSVRLFPRLVSTKATMKPAGTDSDSARVRTRLLRMILENERSRRNDWRPNAG